MAKDAQHDHVPGHGRARADRPVTAYGPNTYICPMCPGVEIVGPAA